MKKAIGTIIFLSIAFLELGCQKSNAAIELSSLIELIADNNSIQVDQATTKYDVPKKLCCVTSKRNFPSLRKCIRCSISGKIPRLANKSEIPFVLETEDSNSIDIEPCSSSFEDFGDFDLKTYLLAHGIRVAKIGCGKENTESDGSFVYKWTGATDKPIFAVYSYTSGSGGFEFSITIYKNKIPDEVLKGIQPCK